MRKLNLAQLFALAVERHKTQTAVAKRCGISQSMVSLYLNGKHTTIKSSNLLRIAHCLGVKPATLLSACEKSVSTTP